jgi:hypothetical protein
MISIERSEIIQIWNRKLEKEDYSWENMNIVLKGMPVFIGLSKQGESSIVFVQNSSAQVIQKMQFGKLYLQSLYAEDIKRNVLVLECIDVDYLSLFAVMCVSTLIELDSKHGEFNLEEEMITECKVWEKVFKEDSENEELGLLGELYIFDLLRSFAYNNFVWNYPIKSTKDFQLSKQSDLEVKTTHRRRGYFVSIHGLQQLLQNEAKSLYLVFVRLEHVAKNGDISLNTLYERNKVCLTPQQMMALGNINQDIRSRTYNVLESKIFTINNLFPRIIPSSLKSIPGNDRIGSVQYSLELSDYPSQDLHEFLKEMR